ncbi:MAG: enoyl-CoA hydratase/isomerase family protein [Deltaproteobacteria bacterium]|nr:enoyl-CoA hydratase/isomerase family protein [Deltaproteobacteria bacterium]MBW2420913.1 enoyl-CoA hydratase/isomerase family protein [Deltaproteobacteria bacterium]
MSKESGLRVEREGAVVNVTFDRPDKKNALTLEIFDELRRVIDAMATDPEARVLVLRGAGGNFSSGADLSGAAPAESWDPRQSPVALIRDRVGAAALALHRLPKPTLALVEGVAAGAGANLALCCDLVYAARGARFSQIFIRRALSLDCGGSWVLPRTVGLRRAKELAFFGDWVSAEDAEDLGLVNAVFEAESAADEVRERAGRLARQAPLALSLIKESLDASSSLSFAEALDKEAVYQGACTGSGDFAEGIAAFLEGREPDFSGS